MKDVARFVSIEDAQARKFVTDEFPDSIIVINLVLLLFLLRERDVIVEVKIVPVRREPFEMPAHSFLI